MGAVADRLSNAYGVRLGLIGLLTTSLFLVQTVTQIPAGRLIDRLGARTVGVGAVCVIALGNALALGARSFWLAVGARALMGLGTGSGFICGTDFARGDTLRQGFYGGSSVGGAGLSARAHARPRHSVAGDCRDVFLSRRARQVRLA